MKKTSRLLLFSSLLAACSLQAQTTVSFTNFNFRGGAGNGGFGIFGAPSAGVVKTQDLTTYAQGAYTPETDFNFRWSGLTLDGAGTGDDYVDFTLRFTSNGPTAGNVQLGGEGIGVQGGLGNRIDEDDPATTEVNEAEQLVIEVVNVSTNALGTVDFDGFTKAEAYGFGGAGLYNVQADVNGTTGSLSKDTTGYFFGALTPVWTGDLQSVTINNTVHDVGGANTVTPRILYRQCDFSFTFTETAGAPTIFDFSLAEGGFPSEESQGSYFTTGTPSNTEAGVYDQASLEFYYDLDNVTVATLKRNGVTETTINNPTDGNITPATQPAGVYEYTLEVTNGTDNAVSQPITVYIQQPLVVDEFSTRSNASQIGDGAKLPLFISATGDFDSEDLSNGLFLTFTDQGETLTEAGAGGTGGDGNLTAQYRLNPVTPLFYSDNLALTSGSGRLDVEVSSIIAALEAANAPLSFPFNARAKLRAVNPAGTTTVDIDFTIQDSQIIVELDPAAFVADSGVLDNQYIGPFVQALAVANGDVVDLTGNGSVSFTSGFGGAISLADEFAGVVSYQEGYRFQNVTHSLWIDVPETPAGGGLIIKWGGDTAGTSIGIDNGNLVARVQNTVTNFTQASAPITAGWHHIAVTIDMGGVDPDNSVALYIDGQLADTGDSPAEVVASWSSNLVGALYDNPGAGGFAGQSAGLFGGGAITNATSGVIRMYRGILDPATIQTLATEFLGSSTSLQIVSTSYTGGQFNVTVSGLQSGTTYYLRRNPGLSGGNAAFFDVSSLTAASDTEVFTDSTPLAGKAFYVVSDASNPAP